MRKKERIKIAVAKIDQRLDEHRREVRVLNYYDREFLEELRALLEEGELKL